MASETPSHLEPSELGTKNYWDNLYTTELTNHAHDPSDVGTVWFDDSDAEAKMLEFLSGLADDADEPTDLSPPLEAPLSKANTTFLDLGCGNGSLLLALRDDGWRGRLLGVDYSSQSVALAKQVALSKAKEAEEDDEEDQEDGIIPPVDFREWDVIAGPYSTVLEPSSPQASGWDVILDKGTFDAISLSDEKDSQGRRLCEGYRERVWELARPGGLFLVTSCNWTESELCGWFEKGSNPDDDHVFRVVGKVEYRSFTFGGAKGQTISTLCLRKQ